MGGPVPLLALGATVASHLAATADVELPELWKDKEGNHFQLCVYLAYDLVGSTCGWLHEKGGEKKKKKKKGMKDSDFIKH